MRIALGAWTPDDPPLDSSGLTVAENVVPQSTQNPSYGSWGALEPLTDALPTPPSGGIAGKSVVGDVASFAGTDTALYRLLGSTWDDVSRAGGYATAADEVWRFINYGYQVIATNYSDPIQNYSIGTSTEFRDLNAISITATANNGSGLVRVTTATAHGYVSGDQITAYGVSNLTNGTIYTIVVIDPTHFDVTGSTFTTVGTSGYVAKQNAIGSPPRARHLAVVRDFLVTANTFDLDGARPLRIRWSPFGNPMGNWTPNPTTMSDFQDLVTGDEVMGLAGGEFGVVLCRSSIYRMTFVGPPLVFQFDEVVRNRGCAAAGSVATDGVTTFFYAEDGFYAFDGAALTPIGAGKINRWFADNLSAGAFDSISAQIDAVRQLYIVLFQSKDSPDSKPDTLLMFNWVTGRWSIARQQANVLTRLLSTSYTLEQLDTVSTSLDALPASLDSRLWSGGKPYLGAFGRDNKFGVFEGSALPATIETGEASMGGDRRAVVQSIRPLCDGTPTVQIGYRDNQWEAEQLSAVETVTRAGDCKFSPIIDARFHRARLLIGGDWTIAQGIDVTASPGGLT